MSDEVRLENWHVAVRPSDPYTAPELRATCLSGEVYGHPRFEDGDRITTSPVRSVEGRRAETNNTTYRLGKVSEQYRDWCRERGIGGDLDGEDLAEVFQPRKPPSVSEMRGIDPDFTGGKGSVEYVREGRD